MQHNRKLLAIILLSALAVFAIAFAGCHEHDWINEEVRPTCTEDGYSGYRCSSCGHETSGNGVVPALGHKFDEDGYCERCGDPDLSNPAFGSQDSGLCLNLTDKGVLSWNRLSSASKYELSVTYFGNTEPTVYTLDKKTASITLDDLDKQDYNDKTSFPSGKCSAKFTPYAIHKETVDGEKIEQEYPVSELADEFKIVKLNGKFELIRMTYADDNLTLKGFYSDVKTDEDGNPYYLYEQLLKDNKATQFNIKNYVQLAQGCTAQYYLTAQDRSNGSNSVSDMDLRFMYVNAGGNNVFYARVNLAQGGYKDYDLRIYGLQTLKLQRYNITSTTDAEGFRNDTYTQIGNDQTYIEGDIIPVSALFAGTSANAARDEKYNYIKKPCIYDEEEDFVLTAPSYGDTIKFYFGGDTWNDCRDYNEYSRFFNLTETDYGWQLYADETKVEYNYELPYKICGKKVLSYSFNNVTATRLYIPSQLTQLNILLTNCTNITDIYLYNPQTRIAKGAFAGANDNLVIHCDFYSTDTTNFDSYWYAKSPTNAYAGNYKVQYRDSY